MARKRIYIQTLICLRANGLSLYARCSLSNRLSAGLDLFFELSCVLFCLLAEFPFFLRCRWKKANIGLVFSTYFTHYGQGYAAVNLIEGTTFFAHKLNDTGRY
jgi:hypothetical protein